ncbi:asparagine--tRNA ligase [Candidatus Purcelliella pentastirinorum]|uniref:Asparagine--tRNA ligase n=1 Tax=Candidatus Purcelliella pentastirinorum TaxID=472834 RepID=A0AAX3N812_9ENTR|nr:asparagine--tRNA ligase [Candidatus Purcelliella pentastirinorum]WDI78518.1 asparagine--tRNA ligase [Candidatus Purcelliella pentastirinorum]
MITTSITHIIEGKLLTETKITINGWVKTKRTSKIGITFISINDGSCLENLQIIIKKNIHNYKNNILKLTTGCSIKVKGIIKYSPSTKQKYEIHAINIIILGWVKDPSSYPISPKKHSMEYLRKIAHLRPRTNIIGAITRIRQTIIYKIHKFLNNHGFYWIPTPIITTIDTEGNGKMFRVSTLNKNHLSSSQDKNINFKKDFFGKETFLTVSGQLNAESYSCALSKVYAFGPTFRAENSNTKKHLSEFWMLEPEIAFAKLNDVIKLAIDMLIYISKSLLNERDKDLFFFEKKKKKNKFKLKKLISSNFEQIDYEEAIKILKKSNTNFKLPVNWGIDISTEHEKYLTEKYFKTPIIIKNYPKKIKPFYMRLNKDNKTVSAMDILMPGIGEIIGGSEREERIEILDKRIKESKLNKKKYWWYRDLRIYGTIPHAGFGMGVERLISFITGVKNIKDIVPFPRTPKNANF